MLSNSHSYMAAILLILLLAGCQSQLLLMPTPEVLKNPDFNVFAEHPYPETINQIESYYVTTRKPAIARADFYQGIPDKQLHFGRALLQIGKPEQNVLEHLQSSDQSSKDSLVWTLHDAQQMASGLRSKIQPRQNVHSLTPAC